MAQLGFRTIEEMIGRVDKMEINPDVLHYKSRGLDLSALLTPATSLNENHSGVSKNFEQVRCGAVCRFACVHCLLPTGCFILRTVLSVARRVLLFTTCCPLCTVDCILYTCILSAVYCLLLFLATSNLCCFLWYAM